MKLETEFDLGQQVFCVRRDVLVGRKTCTFCRGIGFVIGEDKTSELCPKCKGGKMVIGYDKAVWQVRGPFTIGQIQLDVTNSPGIAEETIFDNYKPQVGREERYMLVETGVGSGQVYELEHLLPSKKAAEELAADLNAQQDVGKMHSGYSIGRKEWKGL